MKKSNLKQLSESKKDKIKQKSEELLKKMKKKANTDKNQNTDSDEELEEYEMNKIIDIKLGKENQILYKVLWKGYSDKDFTWEPFEHFNNSSIKKVYEFQQNQKEKFEKIKEAQKKSEKKNSIEIEIENKSDSSFDPENQHGSKQTEIGISAKKNEFKLSKAIEKKVKSGTINFVIEYCPENQDVGPKTFYEFQKLAKKFEKKIQL